MHGPLVCVGMKKLKLIHLYGPLCVQQMLENIPDDSKLEEAPRQFEVTLNMGIDVSKSNLVLYSSVLTLSTDAESVDQHFKGYAYFSLHV